MGNTPVPRQKPQDHPPAGADDQGLAPAFPGLPAALSGSGPSLSPPPPLRAEDVLALLTHPPAVATQLRQHAQHGDEIATLLLQILGEGDDHTLVARLQGGLWLPAWGPVFRWLLDHNGERQALTAALRPGLAPTPPAGEPLRSDPTTPATPTPVLPGQHRPITGAFLRQVRRAMGCSQGSWALIFGVTSRTIQSWEADRHQMRQRSVQVLQQILTDPEGEPHFRELGLTLELPDPNPGESPDPADDPAPPEPPQPVPAGLRQRLRRLFGGPRSAETPQPPC